MKVVVIGTGTDVGKTHVTASLGRHLASLGVNVIAWKPVLTGVDFSQPLDEPTSDAAVLARATRCALLLPHHLYAPPVSAFRAASQVNERIDLDAIVDRVNELDRQHDVVLVETAGGAFSPLDRGITNAHLALRLDASAVLVAPDRLGVIHDLAATMMALGIVGLIPRTVVLSAVATPDASSGGNALELDELGIVRVTTTFDRAGIDDTVTQRSAAAVWAKLT